MGGVARQVAIALGSNLGERAAHLDYGVARLASLLDGLIASRYIESVATGLSAGQPDFLNAAAAGLSAAPAPAILQQLLAIEAERGRARPFPGAPRTLDLDLILCGDEVLTSETLVLPHPRFRERRFVLEPLAAIAPALRDPVTGLTVAELLARQDG